MLFLVGAVAMVGAVPHAHGQTINWSAPAGSGIFQHSFNWSPATVPDSTHTANISGTGAFNVGFLAPAQTNQLHIDSGDVTFAMGGHTYSVVGGGANAQAAGLRVGGWGPAFAELTLIDGELRASYASLGHATGQRGKITLTDSAASLNVQETLFVGLNGVGELRIDNGAKVATKRGVVASGVGDNASLVQVVGDGSEWNLSSELQVAVFGGTSEVVAGLGGKVTAPSLIAGGVVRSVWPDSLIHIQGDAIVAPAFADGTKKDGLSAQWGGTIRIDGNLSYNHESTVRSSFGGFLDVGSITRFGDQNSGGIILAEDSSLRVRGDVSTFDLGIAVLQDFVTLQIDGALQLDPRRTLTANLFGSFGAKLTVGSITGDGELVLQQGTLTVGELTLGGAPDIPDGLTMGSPQSGPFSYGPHPTLRALNVVGLTDIKPGGSLNLLYYAGQFDRVLNEGSLVIEHSTASFLGTGAFSLDGLVSIGDVRITDSTIDGTVLSANTATLEVGGEVVFDAEVRTSSDITSVNDMPGLPLVTFNGGLQVGALFGQIDQIAIDADVIFGEVNRLLLDVGGTAHGDFDSIDVAGSLLLDGALELSFASEYTPKSGDTVEFLTASTITGGFSELSLPTLPAGLRFAVEDIDAGVLRIVPEPGTGVGLGFMALLLCIRRRVANAWRGRRVSRVRPGGDTQPQPSSNRPAPPVTVDCIVGCAV